MKSVTETVESAIKALSYRACIVGGWMLILLSIAISIEVILRKVFHQSLQGIDEYGGYALAATSALAMAYCFYEGAHIRIDLLVRALPKPLRLVSALAALLTLTFVAALLSRYAVALALESYEFGSFANTALRTPLYVPQGIWAAGMCLFLISLVTAVLRVAEAAIRRGGSGFADALEAETGEQGDETGRQFRGGVE